MIGARNTLFIAVIGIALSTVLGVLVGIARLSSNWLVRRAASAYVETIRNIPVLVVIIFFSAAVILTLPTVDNPIEWFDAIVLSKRGLWIPSLIANEGAGAFGATLAAGLLGAVAIAFWRTRVADSTGRPHHRVAWALGTLLVVGVVAYMVLGGPLSVSLPERTARTVAGGSIVGPELAALLAGLVVYTTSHIAEVVRGSIQAVSKGQSEAALALGLGASQRLRFVILPQAFRIAIPPMSNQYLNLTKNSSLGVLIGYPELMRVTRIAIGSGAPAPQTIVVLMLIYLLFSIVIAGGANLANRRLQLRGAR
jgi:general L-amino acid transport system permease protein